MMLFYSYEVLVLYLNIIFFATAYFYSSSTKKDPVPLILEGNITFY